MGGARTLMMPCVYNDSEAAETSDDNTDIDEMSEMSYKINLEIVNTFRNKRKIDEEVDNQISKVTRLFKSFQFGNGSRMSDQNLVYLILNISRTKNSRNKL